MHASPPPRSYTFTIIYYMYNDKAIYFMPHNSLSQEYIHIYMYIHVYTEKRRVLFLKYKGHQTYLCVAGVVTPCQVVLNICQCTLYLTKELLQAGVLELDTLFPFSSTLAYPMKKEVQICYARPIVCELLMTQYSICLN